ncbi:hypothetical protein F5Y19DRAFT_445819 [Xylariaceae sp. FL1651]|nr:hypothetical protein F5Y19DRAFT_445819 [Xylariaceae sp. FL1651]
MKCSGTRSSVLHDLKPTIMIVKMFSATRVYAVLIGLCSAATASLQYCHANAKTPVHLCVAFESWKNETTSETDLLVSLGHQRYANDAGWAAFGLGTGMVGALMFVEYAGPDNVPILSQRRARGHFEPQPETNMPEISIYRLAINGSNWFEASFDCYGCGGDIAEAGGDMSMIWASNTRDKIKTASEDAHLQLHETYGGFVFNMQKAAGVGKRPVEGLNIDFTIPNGNTDQSAGHESHPHSHTDTRPHSNSVISIVSLHGILMTLAFMVLYPAGAVVIRNGSSRAFKMHVGFQIVASCLCLAGLLLAGITIGDQLWAHLSQPHVQLGNALVFLVVVQIFLGWCHHRGYKRRQSTPKTTFSHLFVGRFLVLGGCVNMFLGLNTTGAPILAFIFGAAVTLADIAIVTALAYIRREDLVATSMLQIPAEDAEPFLDKESRS